MLRVGKAGGEGRVKGRESGREGLRIGKAGGEGREGYGKREGRAKGRESGREG